MQGTDETHYFVDVVETEPRLNSLDASKIIELEKKNPNALQHRKRDHIHKYHQIQVNKNINSFQFVNDLWYKFIGAGRIESNVFNIVGIEKKNN